MSADAARGRTARRGNTRQIWLLSWGTRRFFPNYRQRPTNNAGAGWMAGYHVYFDFADGETINVTVSQNENAGSWSIGRGDFETKGDFNGFVAGLVK